MLVQHCIKLTRVGDKKKGVTCAMTFAPLSSLIYILAGDRYGIQAASASDRFNTSGLLHAVASIAVQQSKNFC